MDTLTDRIERLRKAMILPDEGALKELTAEGLSYGHASGVIEDRPTFIAAIVEGKTKYRSITLSNQVMIQSGEVVIVRHRFEADVLIADTLVHSDIQVMQVWQCIRSQWRLVARQAFRVGA